MTAEKREALLMALDIGCFATPRRVPLVELAEDLGVSDGEASGRPRRAMAKLYRRHRAVFDHR